MALAQRNKALPYAEGAAATWAGWAMQCAVRCYEGLKDWRDAELWQQRISERYPNSSLYHWFCFCKRTGHGDVEAARDFVEQYLSAVGDRPELVDAEGAGFFYWLSGSPRRAQAAFRKADETKTFIAAACALAAVADDLGDTAQRDSILDELRSEHHAKAPKMIQVMGIVRDWLPTAGQSPLDVPAVERVIASVPADGQGNIEFFAGWFLWKHGRHEEGRGFLERSCRSLHTMEWYGLIANDALRGPQGSAEPTPVDPRTAS
jgi:hypothetical protein